jgi:hypothetical protein
MTPGASKVAVFNGPQASEVLLRETRQAGIQVIPVLLQNASGLDAGFQAANRAGAAAVITLQDPLFATLNTQGYAQNRQGNKIDSPTTPVCELIPRFGLSVFPFEMCWSRYPA